MSLETGAPPRTSLSVEEARRRILDTVSPISGWERVAIRAALGRVLVEDVIAPCNVPAHDNSAMDGYALCAEGLPASSGEAVFEVIGSAFAGHGFSGIVGKGQAVRIMTGGVMPAGADSVVMQERVRIDGERIITAADIRPGQNVRRAGEDLAAGAVAIPRGKRVGPAELGLAASLGLAELYVARRLRVAFFSTGDELASIGGPLAPGQVYDSNRYTLHGVLTRLGCELMDMGVVPDRPEAIEAAFRNAAASSDVILTSGGVSVGDADFVRELMGRLGEVDFWKIDIKPGRPMAFGRIGNTWMFGLPGNPVAVMVTYYQFVMDALLRISGLDPLPQRPLMPMPCATPIRKLTGRREYQRGWVFVENGAWKVRAAASQGSGILRSMSEANCFIVLAEDRGDVAPGDTVDVQLFDGLV
ncbi:MAG: molybdopterin molybdotransferase MoeA [Zoogloea sp.]|nr:molybdopterin molybdotransferase MoeA [Zoogloea sp.]